MYLLNPTSYGPWLAVADHVGNRGGTLSPPCEVGLTWDGMVTKALHCTHSRARVRCYPLFLNSNPGGNDGILPLS